MLLAIDIGNTNLVIGCIENDKILFKARIATDATRKRPRIMTRCSRMSARCMLRIRRAA